MVEFPKEKSFPDTSSQRSNFEECLLRGPMEVGQTWYLIDSKWFTKFKKYVEMEKSENGDNCHPGPIDNSPLLDPEMNIRHSLIQGVNYEALPAEAWNLLLSWYGIKDHQTTIERKVINIGRSPKVEPKLEVYKVGIKIYSSVESESSSLSFFSQADKIEKIEEVGRKLFPIPEEAKVQIRCYYGPNQWEVLSKDSSIYEELRNNDCKIVVEIVKDEEKPKSFTKPALPKNKDQPRVTRMTTNRGMGMVTRNSASAVGSAEGRGPPCTPGLSGLMNLGNTCFLNSVFQCLSNCGPVTQYFLDGKHLNEINATNPLGRAGQIALSFADVLAMMWSGKHSTIVPHYLKLQLTKFAPQFDGGQQCDAHELLTFLLDGLHEDLNRIKEKPYFQREESDIEDYQALAQISWDYFIRRNDSIIIDHFQGMLKSRVVCPDCEKVSMKFDTFSTLSLPLPLRCDRTMTVRYVPYNQSLKIKDLIILVPQKGLVRDITIELNKITGVKQNQMVISEINKSHFHKFLAMDDPIEGIEERDRIFMYSLPEELIEGEERKFTVLPVVLWEVQENRSGPFLNSLFGTPFLISLPQGPMYYKTFYDRICERLIRSTQANMKANKNFGCLSMDIEPADGVICDIPEYNNVFTPVFVDSNNFGKITKIPNNEQDLFEVPVSFGQELLALQIPRQDRLELYKEPPVTKENHANGFCQSKPTLEDCLMLFTTTEKLGEKNAWHCPRCKVKKRATKKLDLWKLPNILVFHLKRFAFTETRKEKLSVKIEFPLTGLNIDHYVVNKHKEKFVYDLIGVVNHYGSGGMLDVMGGHYTACCKSYRDGKWYCFDDNSVTPVLPESVQTESAYVLFYQRRPVDTGRVNTRM